MLAGQLMHVIDTTQRDLDRIPRWHDYRCRPNLDVQLVDKLWFNRFDPIVGMPRLVRLAAIGIKGHGATCGANPVQAGPAARTPL